MAIPRSLLGVRILRAAAISALLAAFGVTAASASPLEPFYDRTPSYEPNAVMVSPRRIETVNGGGSDDESIDRAAAPRRLSGPIVPGTRAILRDGIAYAPSEAPDNIKRAIWAVNRIHDKPYKWGGGHSSFWDSGYDCSGTVSFALYNAGLISSPLASAELASYGNSGRGRWFTIYARNGHTFAVIAGLRLDTTDFFIGGDVGPRWHEDGRSTWGFAARHPAGA